MSNIEPTPFGDKYVLVEHIATGGMAEIYRAHYRGIEGFAKELVIKVLREEFAAREDVVEMFLNEARVAATLTHNNVVHTYDLGELEGEYFIAMELLRGEELVDVLRRAHQVGQGVPLEITLGVIMQSLEGLHYVHSQTDADGRPLGLVHRDINPTNIHVGYDGVCKILDFGIAATRASALAKGGIAGKLSYMAPEQAQGQPLDARADIFAMGIILYEMALGRRLFRGPRDEVLQRVVEGDIPAPTFVDPEFPPELEAVIMKALEVDPAERYQNADHMFRDLEAFLHDSRLTPTSRRVSAFMADLFGEGKPAQIDYADEYDDLVDEALDFEAYEGLEDSQEEAPDWVRNLESTPSPQGAARKRRMTIGSLEALVGEQPQQPQQPQQRQEPDAPTPGGEGRRASSRHHRVIPKAAETTRSRRRAAQSGPQARTTGARRAVPTGATGSVPADSGPAGSAFGRAVVTDQSTKTGAAVAWLVAVLGAGGLAWFAYTVLTSK